MWTDSPAGLLLPNMPSSGLANVVRTTDNLLLDYSKWSPANAAQVIQQLAEIFNPRNVSGPGVYRSGTGAASSSGTTVTVDSTVGLMVGMRVTVIAGTGRFANSNATTTTEVQSITSATQFIVTRAPTTPLAGATIYGCKVFKIQTGPNHTELSTGSGAWEGCTYMPNGNVCFTPVVSTNIGTFDPKTMTYFRGPAHGETSSSFGAGTLGPDGNVYFAGTNSGFYGKFDPNTNFYTRMVATSAGTPAFGGLVQIPDGRLVAVPIRSANVDIFNTVANTKATVAHGLGGTDFFSSGTIHPNGKVYMCPWGNTCTRVGIFDPTTNTFSQGASVGVDSAVATKYEGAVVMPNGKICFIPNKATVIGIYNPLTDTWTDGPAHNLVTTNGVFSGGTLMADGRVLMVPRSANTGIGLFGIYDPISDCFSTNAGMTVYSATTNALIGGVMTQGGKFVAAGASMFPVVLDTESQTVNSHQMCLHPLYNKQ